MQRISMNHIQQVLKLKYISKLSTRQIQTLLGISRSSISNYCKLFEQSRLKVDQIESSSDKDLEVSLYGETKEPISIAKAQTTTTDKPHPDWNYVYEQLKIKGVTRMLLWEEYKQNHPNGYGYSQFKKYYVKYTKKLAISMRQIHYAGDKLFIDFSGLTVPIVDAKTKLVSKAQIFVSVLGASGYTYVEAVPSQTTADFIKCHINSFYFYEGVPNILVPDNLKAAVTSHKKGVVKLNPSYAHMAKHYKVAVEPARPYKPQDKSKVELGVKGIQRWILAKLRHHTFFSIEELNDAIAPLLDQYNNKIIRKLGKSRSQLFEEIEKSALHPMTTNRFVHKEFKRLTVAFDCHIEIDGNGYSVPYSYVGEKVDIAYTTSSVEISYKGKIICTHPRRYGIQNDSTNPDHMPKEYQYQYDKWNPKRITQWAQSVGDNTLQLIEKIMSDKTHVVRSYKYCIRILSLSTRYSNEQLELACKKALIHNITSMNSIENMIKLKTYHTDDTLIPANNIHNNHENIRGSQYYNYS